MRISRTAYAEAVANALRADLDGNHHAIKTVMRWTGSNERTVKNWMAGTHGPSGEHLVTLAYYSESVMAVLFQLTGKTEMIKKVDASLLRSKIIEALAIIDSSSRNVSVD